MEEDKQFPSLFQQAKNITKAVGRHVASGFEKVSIQEYSERLSICSSCEYERNGKCLECGCFLKKKAWWKSENCPKDKWKKQE